MSVAKTKAEVCRALAQSELSYLGEWEVVNEGDQRALTTFLTALLRKEKKLRIFVAERLTQPQRRR